MTNLATLVWMVERSFLAGQAMVALTNATAVDAQKFYRVVGKSPESVNSCIINRRKLALFPPRGAGGFRRFHKGGGIQTNGLGFSLWAAMNCSMYAAGLHNRQREIPRVSKQIVGALPIFPVSSFPVGNDSAIGKISLFGDGMGIVIPTGWLKPGDDEFAAGVCLIERVSARFMLSIRDAHLCRICGFIHDSYCLRTLPVISRPLQAWLSLKNADSW